MIKKIIVILACGALIAPVAFAQTRSTHERQATTTTEGITVTGTVIKMTTEEGSGAKYQPVKTLIVFSRTAPILRAVMFSTGVVTL